MSRRETMRYPRRTLGASDSTTTVGRIEKAASDLLTPALRRCNASTMPRASRYLLQVRLTKAEKVTLARRARRMGRSMTWLVKDMIAAYSREMGEAKT
jgi:hypothetical protein